jgi:hypothetical protein
MMMRGLCELVVCVYLEDRLASVVVIVGARAENPSVLPLSGRNMRQGACPENKEARSQIAGGGWVVACGSNNNGAPECLYRVAKCTNESIVENM